MWICWGQLAFTLTITNRITINGVSSFRWPKCFEICEYGCLEMLQVRTDKSIKYVASFRHIFYYLLLFFGIFVDDNTSAHIIKFTIWRPYQWNISQSCLIFLQKWTLYSLTTDLTHWRICNGRSLDCVLFSIYIAISFNKLQANEQCTRALIDSPLHVWVCVRICWD